MIASENRIAPDAFPLRISSPAQEGVLQVSKWLHWQVLLDEEEMAALFEHLSPFSIHIVSTLVEEPHGRVSCEQFLSEYALYIAALKNGIDPDEKRCRPIFSSVFTKEQEALYAMEVVGKAKYLIKPLLPVIQLQLHHVFLSHVDGKFYPMVHASDSITWGVQFSYPQLFQDPQTRDFAKIDDSPRFPNTPLFARLAKWLRSHTLPTPFVVNGQKVNLPIRLGKGCWEWIAAHPHLSRKNIAVSPRSH
jgi:hypothetical protein